MRIIPIASGLRSSLTKTYLGGREYFLGLQWSDFEECFYLSISDANGSTLVTNLRVVSNLRLIAGVGPLGSMPAGELVVLDASPRPTDPKLETLGEQHRLAFIEGAAA